MWSNTVHQIDILNVIFKAQEIQQGMRQKSISQELFLLTQKTVSAFSEITRNFQSKFYQHI